MALLVFALVHRRAKAPLLLDSGRGRPMVSVTGTLFAVVLAFVMLAAFQTYDGARGGAATEANAVLDMFRTAAFYPVAERGRLRADLVSYGRAVVNEEWPAMRHGHSSSLVDHWVGAYRTGFGRLMLGSPRQQLAFQDLLTRAATRTAGRQQRLSDDVPTVPTPLWWALIFGGCVTVALELGMIDPRELLLIHGLMVAGTASVVTACPLIVFFLDHPYQRHVGGIQPSAMRHTLVLMQNIEPGLPLVCTKSGRAV